MLYSSLIDAIGHTPLVHLSHLDQLEDAKGKVFAKVEGFNPAGSAKDRAAFEMIVEAEEKGELRPGSTIIEPTSGNTGIGLASIAAQRGYSLILTMPETMSLERRKLLMAYGAKIVLTPGDKGMTGAILKAQELSTEIENSWIAGQFDNPANPQAHYKTTGPEIWQDLQGKIDILVAGIGTGGTISGIGRYLKEKDPKIKVIGVEPKDSPVLTEGKAGPHGLQGIGAGFVPKNLDQQVLDSVVTITTAQAYSMSRKLARKEGLLAGISSGAALYAAYELAKQKENQGKNIVVVLPDTGERYLSTSLFEEEE